MSAVNGKPRSPNLSLETGGLENSHVRNRTSPKTGTATGGSEVWSNNDAPKSKALFQKSKFGLQNVYICIIVIGLLVILYYQFSSVRAMTSGRDRKKLTQGVIEKNVETEISSLPRDESSLGHLFWLGIDRVRPCNSVDGMIHLIPGSNIDENTYYTHRVHVLQGGWVYGQICISPHEHEHVVEIYSDLGDHADADPGKDFDCDIYISSHGILPEDLKWDFRSNNKGNDHIKLPLYLEDFRDYKGAVIVGIFGRGGAKEPNDCTLTLKINTLENEELLHKLNLRHGQVIMPRDIGISKYPAPSAQPLV